VILPPLGDPRFEITALSGSQIKLPSLLGGTDLFALMGVPMIRNKFQSVATYEGNEKWEIATARESSLAKRRDDIRTEFARDYTRILHSTAYRRLKHKTQVFFATANDHVCTRIEHVNHVASVSHTIATFLGLNTELTQAIAIGHDLGHAPFGHAGETYLKTLANKHLGETFWHERNSLRFVDEIETLENPSGKHINLQLTYAVRDGIICHCGEIDENSLFPRSDAVDLKDIQRPNEYKPYTWEGCIVKISDKIAYLGRDIEDAISLRILTMSEKRDLLRITQEFGGKKIREINNTMLIHRLIIDLCRNSSQNEGIKISSENIRLMNSVKKFNYDNIYYNSRLNIFKKYAELIITSLFSTLMDFYTHDTDRLLKNIHDSTLDYPYLSKSFHGWISKYGISKLREVPGNIYNNKIIYDIGNEEGYTLAIIDFLSGMTDQYAIRSFNETTSFI
jgi:dGTPase